MWIRALLVATALAVAGAPAADAAPVRIFAIGNKQRVEDAASHKSYRDKMAALMDARHPGRASLVQQGVGDVASHLRPADPGAPARALVVFPEDVGLINMLIGSRGDLARRQRSAIAGVLSLFGPYSGLLQHYGQRHPGQPAIRILFMALTDTLYRSFYETFRELAIEHGVYIAAAMNAPPARRVEQSADPALVALLRDPDEPGRTYAYEAVSPYVTNTTYVFAPDGEVLVPDGRGGTLRSPSQTGGVIRSSTSKAYLTPPEQPPPGELLGLGLDFGAVSDLEVLDTPVGRLGTVISKDAWMVDVNDRLAAKGANLLLQPEAFSAWAFATSPWEPDIFKQGGFANLQKLPEFRVNVNASMTGNFFDSTFDGQSAIIVDKRKADPGPLGSGNAFVGQNPDGGFLALAPWIAPDPGIGEPALTLVERRTQLVSDGFRLKVGPACPDSLAVGPCLNGYREAIVWADVDVPAGPVTSAIDRVRESPPRFERSVRVSGRQHPGVENHLRKGPKGGRLPPGLAKKFRPATERAPRVAAANGRVHVVWQQRRGGLDQVWLATSADGGSSFAPPVRVSDNGDAVRELHPSVAAEGGRVVVTWQELGEGGSDESGRIMLARFDHEGRKLGGDLRVDDTDAGGKWVPAVTLAGERAVVVWIDERERGPEQQPLEHVYAARENAGGAGFGVNVRVDSGSPVPLSVNLDNKWSPTITHAGGKVYAAWADFRNYNWDIYFARSDDDGASFGASSRVDDFGGLERLNERPSLAIGPLGEVHAAWSDLRAREPDTNIFYARSDNGGATFSPSRQLDDSKLGFDPDRDTPTNQWHPSLAGAGDRLFAAWQDNRLGNNDIFFTTSRDGGATFAPSERIDDSGDGHSEQARPHLAWSAGSCYAVWEDDRNGTSDIYLGRRSCPEGAGR